MKFIEPKEAFYRLNSAWGQTPGHFGWSNVLGSDPKSDFVAACAEGLGHGGAYLSEGGCLGCVRVYLAGNLSEFLRQ